MAAREYPSIISLNEFEQLVRLPENTQRLFEYIGGEVVEVVSNNYSSIIAMVIGSFITIFVRQHGLGRVTGADGGYTVSGEKYIPDVAFISRARQPQPSHETYNPLAPDLAVEVLSPLDSARDIRMKIANYMLSGTMLWLVDPELKHIEVYVSGKPPQTLGMDGVLDGGSVLPGFKLPVKDIFAD